MAGAADAACEARDRRPPRDVAPLGGGSAKPRPAAGLFLNLRDGWSRVPRPARDSRASGGVVRGVSILECGGRHRPAQGGRVLRDIRRGGWCCGWGSGSEATPQTVRTVRPVRRVSPKTEAMGTNASDRLSPSPDVLARGPASAEPSFYAASQQHTVLPGDDSRRRIATAISAGVFAPMFQNDFGPCKRFDLSAGDRSNTSRAAGAASRCCRREPRRADCRDGRRLQPLSEQPTIVVSASGVVRDGHRPRCGAVECSFEPSHRHGIAEGPVPGMSQVRLYSSRGSQQITSKSERERHLRHPQRAPFDGGRDN